MLPKHTIKLNHYIFIKNILYSFGLIIQDNDDYNGLLLLSYPSVEAFTLSVFEDKSYLHEAYAGNDLKNYIVEQDYTNKKLKKSIRLQTVVTEFLNALTFCGITYDTTLADNLGAIGLELYNVESKHYEDNNTYFCISQLVEILIDLGIVDLFD